MSQDKGRSAGRDYTEIHVTKGGKYAGRDFYDYSGGKEGLAEVAGEIQQLLEQLGPTCAINTTTGKMTVAMKIIEVIDRILSALRAGAVQALVQFLNHPAASFVINALEDWRNNKRLYHNNTPQPTPRKRGNDEAKLLKRVKEDVAGILYHSLQNRVYMILDKEENPEQVEFRYSIEVKTGTKPKSRLENTSIIDVFDREEIAGKLFIFGEPGSGKTTELVKLAQKLVQRAIKDEQEPIPVLFNLSSWKKDNQSIEDWLVQELRGVKDGILRRIKYGIGEDIARKLVQEQAIIPLLDGLDELAAPRQPKCVEKINQFLSGWSTAVVVCSREEEYNLYEEQLELHNAVKLLPLTEEKVFQFLEDTGNRDLWEDIQGDRELQELVTKPLFLTILVLSVQEIALEQWKGFSSQEERLHYLFEAYIRRMFKRPYEGKNQPQEKETRRWLGWLAQRLIEENQTEFFIYKITPYWLTPREIGFGELIYGLIFRLIHVLIYGYTFGLNPVLIYGLISGLIVGLIYVLMLGWMLRQLSMRSTQEFQNKTYPNQGIWNSLKNVVTIGLMSSPLLALLIWIWKEVNDFRWLHTLIPVIGIAFVSKMLRSEIPVIQNISLRLVLWKKGYAPWNYARFLDYATNRLFLQRVGGGYRFIHDLLREHFKTTDGRR